MPPLRGGGSRQRTGGVQPDDTTYGRRQAAGVVSVGCGRRKSGGLPQLGQTTGFTQADLSGGLRRPVGRLRAKEVRGTSVARPDDAAYAIASTIAAAGRSAVPKQGNGLPCGGVGGECQTGASYEKHSPPLRGAFRLPFATAHGPSVPAPSGQPPLQEGLSCPSLNANWY